MERVRVLVIDDDTTFGSSVVRRLSAVGIEGRFHQGPFGCLQAIRDMRCDVVVLDVNMPKLDGPLVIRMIRDSVGMGTTRVLLCSNMEPGPLARLATASGAHGFLAKQAIEVELVPKLRAVLALPLSRPVATRKTRAKAVEGADTWHGRGTGR